MTAPARIVYGPRNTYRLDPYVRDTAGRFAPKPATTPPPVEAIEATGRVVVEDDTVRWLYNDTVVVCDDPAGGNRWRVRVIIDTDGSARVECTPEP